MFPTNDSATTTPPLSIDRVRLSGVPRRHQYYEGAKTSCAEYEVAYGFASSLQSFFSTFAPCGGEVRKVGPGLYRPVPQGHARLVEHRSYEHQGPAERLMPTISITSLL